MTMRSLYLNFFLLLYSTVASQGQTVYALKECISMGLERNFSILVARNDETIAANNFTRGNAGYLPTVDLSGRYGGTLNNTNSVSHDGSRTSTPGVHNTTATGGATLGWTVFNGFSVKSTYQKLNELKQLGTLNTQLQIENLVSQIVSGYYNYIQQVQALKNLNYALSLSRERLRIDNERYELGAGSKLMTLQSQVYLNADSSSLARQHEVVRTARINLNELMAAENLGEDFFSADTSIIVDDQLLYETLYDQTLAGNTSLLIASKNKTISEYDYKIITSRSYPYVNLTTGYNYNYNTYETGNYKRQAVDGLNYGVSLGFNIFNGLNQKKNIANSNIEINNRELRLLEVEQGVKADLLAIYNAYNNNLRLIKLEEQNLQTATENLDIALERYKLGNLSGIELREVQKSLLDAKDRLLAIQYQSKLAEISLKLISGSIMEYYE